MLKIVISILTLSQIVLAQTSQELVNEKTLVNIPDVITLQNRSAVRLYDVVEIKSVHSDLNLELSNLFKQVVLYNCTSNNCEKYLTRNDLSQKIREATIANTELKKVQFIIPEMLKVATITESKEEIIRKLKNQTIEKCFNCRVDVRINLNSRDLTLLQDWDLDFAQFTGRGSFLIPVTYMDSNKPQKWISGQIRIEQQVPTAARMLPQGEKISASDINYKWLDTTYAKDKILTQEEIIGQLALRTLNIDSPLWASNLKQEEAVKRGQLVKVLTGTSDFEVSTNCISEDNGKVGDLIKVKLVDTSKIIAGTIIEKGIVRVE